MLEAAWPCCGVAGTAWIRGRGPQPAGRAREREGSERESAGAGRAFFLTARRAPPHRLPPSTQEMCAQMYSRGKMFGFVHLYSGQEAVSTGVIRCVFLSFFFSEDERGPRAARTRASPAEGGVSAFFPLALCGERGGRGPATLGPTPPQITA